MPERAPIPRRLPPDRAERLEVEGWDAPPAQAVTVLLARPLAGMGTARQLEQAFAGLTPLLARGDVRLDYVGPPAPEGIVLPPATVTIPVADEVPATFKLVTAALEAHLGALVRDGVRRALLVSMGYTAFGPEALKRAMASLARSEEGRALEVELLIVDSAFPDTDEEDHRLDDEGWPLGRFYTPAYAATARSRVWFLITSAYDYDLDMLHARTPPGLTGVGIISPPYTDAYVVGLAARASEARREGRAGLAARLTGRVAAIDRLRDDALVVPIVSSDVWSPSHVGAWMSPEEHETCTGGTRAVLEALVSLSEELGRPVYVPVDRAGAACFAANAPAGVSACVNPGDAPSPGARVVLGGYRNLPQDDHARLLAVADLAVSRTGGQSNAAVVLAMTGVPNVVMDMPARGYMQSELTSFFTTHEIHTLEDGALEARPLAQPLGWWTRWDTSATHVRDLLREALTVRGEREARADAARRAYTDLLAAPWGNFLHIVDVMTRPA